jgi:hypothetical protein
VGSNVTTLRYLRHKRAKGRKCRPWTAEDEAVFLALQADGATCREIAARMGRTLQSTQAKSKRLRTTPGRKFVPNTLEFVLNRLATEVVEDPETGCLLWQGGKISQGYGEIALNGRKQLAHRIAYEGAKGPIPEGLQIDHLCRRRNCVNPDHLEPVTQAENLKRARQTHCKRGHALTDDNVYVSPKLKLRQCRKCNAIRRAASLERRRG